MNPPIYIKKHEIYIQGDMADYLNDEGIRGKEKVYNQASTTINIFNWRSALKEEVIIFIKQQKEDYKDEYLYDFTL